MLNGGQVSAQAKMSLPQPPPIVLAAQQGADQSIAECVHEEHRRMQDAGDGLQHEDRFEGPALGSLCREGFGRNLREDQKDEGQNPGRQQHASFAQQ